MEPQITQTTQRAAVLNIDSATTCLMPQAMQLW